MSKPGPEQLLKKLQMMVSTKNAINACSNLSQLQELSHIQKQGLNGLNGLYEEKSKKLFEEQENIEKKGQKRAYNRRQRPTQEALRKRFSYNTQQIAAYLQGYDKVRRRPEKMNEKCNLKKAEDNNKKAEQNVSVAEIPSKVIESDFYDHLFDNYDEDILYRYTKYGEEEWLDSEQVVEHKIVTGVSCQR